MGDLHHTFWGWVIGLGLISGLMGWLVTVAVWIKLRSTFHKIAEERNWDLKEEDGTTGKTPHSGRILGPLERAFFTVLTAFEVSGVASAIPAWMAVKLVSGWNRISKSGLQYRFAAFNSLTCSLVSMFFAVVGGLIASGRVPVYSIWERSAGGTTDLSQDIATGESAVATIEGGIDIRTVFMLFFAIAWGATANAQLRWKPFHWPAIHRLPQARRRLFLSIICLNALPLLCFCLFLWILGSEHNRGSNLNPSSLVRLLLCGVLPAWCVFGCYRIWLGIVELTPERYYPLTSESLPPGYNDLEPTVQELWKRETKDLLATSPPFRPGAAVLNITYGALHVLLAFLVMIVGVLMK